MSGSNHLATSIPRSATASTRRPAASCRRWITCAWAGAAMLLALNGGVLGADAVVILSADAGHYRQAVEGFRQSSGYRIIEQHDLKGDVNRGSGIMRQVERDKPDLIFAVGIYALQAAVKSGTDIPVVYAMVLNPPSVIGAGTQNITGASMNVSVEQTLSIFQRLGNIRRIGTIYDPDETGFLIDEARRQAQQMGMELVAKEARSPKQAITAVEELKKADIDALWMVPDPRTLAPNVQEQMLLLSYRKKVPLLGVSEAQAKMGSMMAIYFGSSEDIGRQAGELAKLIAQGKSVSEVPFTLARTVNVVVNLKAARKMGIDVPQPLLSEANAVIQ